MGVVMKHILLSGLMLCLSVSIFAGGKRFFNPHDSAFKITILTEDAGDTVSDIVPPRSSKVIQYTGYRNHSITAELLGTRLQPTNHIKPKTFYDEDGINEHYIFVLKTAHNIVGMEHHKKYDRELKRLNIYK